MGSNAAMQSAIAQSRILTEYLCGVDAESVDLRFVENHLKSLYQFACSAKSEARTCHGECDCERLSNVLFAALATERA
jgi:hypothetical protein